MKPNDAEKIVDNNCRDHCYFITTTTTKFFKGSLNNYGV